MKFRHALTLAAMSLVAAGGPAFAQSVQENSDADALAADMRLLAANPMDIEALIKAGEITLRMGDTTASATFFGRAERLDPLNSRVKAGMASLVLRAERPGEALRRFRDAETRGLDPRKFAADRGLAYDLIGEQERAQRDYRLALQAGPDDEVTRRYALSLGISGRGEEAMKLLDPLLRRSDRAAWRDRAFILAMTGDREGAQKIASSMMSPGLGAGLAPFFQRLPQLSPVDRAYAVTFGELLSSPARAADARLAPPMAKLGPDPTAPKVVVAAAAPVKEPKEDKNKKRKKDRDPDKRLAPVSTPPVEVAAALPPPPAAPGAQTSVPTVQPLPSPTRTAALPPKRATNRPVVKAEPQPLSPVVAKTEPKPVAPIKVETRPEPKVAEVKAEPVRSEPKPAPATSTPVEVAARPAAAPATPLPSASAAPARVELAAVSSPPPVATTLTSQSQGTTAPVVVPPPAAVAVAEPAPPQPGVADQPSAAEAGIPRTTGVAKVSEDSVLARIIAGIDVPGSELGVAPLPARASPTSAPKPEPKAEPKPTPPAVEIKPDSKPAKVAVDAKSATKPIATTDSKGRSAKSKTELADTDAKAAKARGRNQSADQDTDTVNCLTADAKSRPGTRGKSATSTTRGRGTTAKGKPDTNCKAANARGKGQSADEDDSDAVDCLPPETKSRTGRGKSAASTTRGRSTTAKGKADTNCKGAGNTKTRGKTASDGSDAVDCPKLDAKGRAGVRKVASKAKADTRCVAADKKSDTVSTKGEAARIWVQVAGGANEASLEKAWAGVKAKAPDLFRGRQGWSTPLRATNRVLTGPFKSADEAQEFVNKLSKAGLSGFVFTSTKGQKVDRLP
jgi:Flp pilus assembly protein TadD